MAFQSPYRGEESLLRLSPRAREIISRAAMVLVAMVLITVSVRGMMSMYAMQHAAAVQAAQQTGPGQRPPRTWVPVMPWLSLIGTGLLGSLTLAAALLPVATMQSLFERWNQPPVTGDRSGDDRGWRWWWWWP